MRILTPIVNVALVLALIFSGLPLFSLQDANRDSVVNLEDAILHVKGFARTAEEPATFRTQIEKAVSTLYVVSGLKSVIKQAGDTKSTTTLPALDFPYLISSNDLLPPLNNFCLLYTSPSPRDRS